MYHVVTYAAPLGYLKPASAVRDGETYSQRFLPPSTVEGIRIKLGVEEIADYRLKMEELSPQQEVIQGATPRTYSTFERETSILVRHVMVRPRLKLAFNTQEEAETALKQHICLCRNEDVAMPVSYEEMGEEAFGQLPGYSFEEDPDGDIVGYNRYTESYDRGNVLYNPAR